MAFDIYTRAGSYLGRLVRQGARTVYAYDAEDSPLGNFGDSDAAITALMQRAERRAAA